MTRQGTQCRPLSSATARALLFALAATASGLVATMAMAQQGWDAAVTTGQVPPPKAALTRQAQPKPKAQTPVAVVIERDIEPALLAEDRKVAAPKVATPAPVKIETGSIKGPRPDDYCASIANPAADARFAWQKKTLADMEGEIVKRIALLEEKTAEYQKWLTRRDEFSKKANETILLIYARMRPDAAAAQLAALDEETAAAVLTKLEPRTASLILSEMDAAQAVRLTGTISGAGKVIPAASRPAVEAKAK